MKTCKKCNIEMDYLFFYKCKNTKDGFTIYCKGCKKVMDSLYGKKYYIDNKDSLNLKRRSKDNSEYMRDYYLKNKELLRKNNNEYKKNRIKSDVLFKLSTQIRTSINNSIKRNGYNKISKTYDILGCSFEEFRIYLESKFEVWMTWENRGLYNGEFNYGWDIDHIIPVSSAKNEEDIIKLNHYTNFQPLCSYINRDKKINKIDEVYKNKI